MSVPDAMASEIPSSLLVFSEGAMNISVINRMKWTQDQVNIYSFTQRGEGTGVRLFNFDANIFRW